MGKHDASEKLKHIAGQNVVHNAISPSPDHKTPDQPEPHPQESVAPKAKPKRPPETKMERSQPIWLRIVLNLCGPAGLVVTLMGWLSPGWGLFIAAVGLAYVLWEIQPHISRVWLILAGLIAIGLLGLSGWKMWPKANIVIVVAPEKMLFTPDGNTYDVKVRNVSESDAYVVELLIRADNNIGSEDDFAVDVPDSSLHELEGPSRYPPWYDVSAASCKNAEAGKKLTYLFAIDHMAPHETRDITMVYKAGQRVDLTGKIVSFQTTEPPMSSTLSDGTTRTRPIPVKVLGCEGEARLYIFRPKQTVASAVFQPSPLPPSPKQNKPVSSPPRPFLFFDSVNTESDESGFKVIFRNSSSVPAIDVSTQVQTMIGTPGQEPPWDSFSPALAFPTSSGNVAPESAIFAPVTSGKNESPEAFAMVKNGIAGLFVYGQATYKDLQGNSYRPRFCVRWEPAKPAFATCPKNKFVSEQIP